MIVPYLMKLGPPRFRRFLINISPSRDLRKVKDIVDIMANTSNGIYREKLDALRHGDKAVIEQVGEGKDVMSILCKLIWSHLICISLI